jgi:ketosteroid isomerase-like protein
MSDWKTARQVVDEAYAALFERGDLEGFLNDFDDNSTLIEADSLPYGGTFRGKDPIRTAIQNVFGYWKDFAYDIENVVYGEEYVIAYGRFSATSVKSGRKLDIPLAEAWRVREGRVAFVHPIYSDTKLALDVLG